MAAKHKSSKKSNKSSKKSNKENLKKIKTTPEQLAKKKAEKKAFRETSAIPGWKAYKFVNKQDAMDFIKFLPNSTRVVVGGYGEIGDLYRPEDLVVPKDNVWRTISGPASLVAGDIKDNFSRFQRLVSMYENKTFKNSFAYSVEIKEA
jgi:hypothetical protein